MRAAWKGPAERRAAGGVEAEAEAAPFWQSRGRWAGNEDGDGGGGDDDDDDNVSSAAHRHLLLLSLWGRQPSAGLGLDDSSADAASAAAA